MSPALIGDHRSSSRGPDDAGTASKPPANLKQSRKRTAFFYDDL